MKHVAMLNYHINMLIKTLFHAVMQNSYAI